MVDKFYFVFSTLLMYFTCICIGWKIGVADTKKKYRERARKNEMENL